MTGGTIHHVETADMIIQLVFVKDDAMINREINLFYIPTTNRSPLFVGFKYLAEAPCSLLAFWLAQTIMLWAITQHNPIYDLCLFPYSIALVGARLVRAGTMELTRLSGGSSPRIELFPWLTTPWVFY